MAEAGPLRIEDVAKGLTTTEAVTARICALTTEIGLLRQYRTKLRRAERGVDLASIKRDFEAGMSRPAICRKHRVTLGQLTGCANRGGWKCSLRRSGQKPAVPDERLPALKRAYETDPSMLKVIAGRFGIGPRSLGNYAARHGWVRAGSRALPTIGTVEAAVQVSA